MEHRRCEEMNGEFNEEVETVARWIVESKRLVIFTGAGISTESGIPDFRGPDGVWTRRDKGLPRRSVDWSSVEPNPGHMAIVELQDMGKLDFLISQNIDNLHLKSGILPDKITELHGNRTLMRCLSCDELYKKEEVEWDDSKWGRGSRRSQAIEGQPKCPKCKGRLISSVVGFGDPMPRREMQISIEHSRACDLFIILGSSLVVRPAADMPLYALEAGAKLVLINMGETPLDNMVQLRIERKTGEIMSAIVIKIKNLLNIYGT
jgi:NAD-dependent SIR2 family protein deacetylase